MKFFVENFLADIDVLRKIQIEGEDTDEDDEIKCLPRVTHEEYYSFGFCFKRGVRVSCLV